MGTVWILCRFFLFPLTLIHLIATSVGNECGQYMEHIVSGPNGVPDGNISASSYYQDGNFLHQPKYGRLYHHSNNPPSEAWSAAVRDTNQYIQVAFNNPMIVCAVLTQGRAATYMEWILSFTVLHSLDGTTWKNMKNIENNLTFNGNTNRTTVVRNDFKECVEANYMRINPRTWQRHISMRMGFLGCSKMRREYLSLKDTKNSKVWKRVSVYRNNLDNLSEHRAPHLGSCAIACHKMPRCADYEFNPNDNNCVLLAEEKYSQNIDNAVLKPYTYSRNMEYLALTNDYEINTNGIRKVYYKIITEKKTKSEASQTCAGDNGRLLVIDNSMTTTFIQKDIENSLICAQETEYFVNGEYNEGKWMFDTNVTVPVSLWAPSFPVSGNDNCIVITATGLKTKDCQSQLYFVCQMWIK